MQCVCTILSSVASSTVQYSSTFSHKRHDLKKKKSNLNEFCLFVCVLHETFLFLRRVKRDMIKNVYWSSCQVLVILVRF